MATLDPLALPYTLSGTQVEATFSVPDPLAGPNVGVALSSISHRTQGTTFEVGDAIAATGFRQALWELEGIEFDEGGNRSIVIARPGVGTENGEFDAYGPFVDGVKKSVIFEWRNVEIGSARVSVRIMAQIEDTTLDDSIQWFGYVWRENTSRVMLREFAYPVVVLKGFSSQRGGDANHADAQARTRFLTPIAFNEINGLHQFANHPFTAFAGTSILKERFPGSLKMPWVCWCSGNDLGAEFRMNFAIRMKRSSPHQGRMWWQWARDGDTAYMLGGCSFILSTGRDFAGIVQSPGEFGERIPESVFENTFAAPDPVLIEMFASKNNDFWWDICERHRADYVAGASPVPLRQDPNKTAFVKKPRLFLAMWIGSTDPELENEGIRNYRELGQITQKIYENTDGVQVVGSIAHQQIHQRGFAGGVLGEFLDPELRTGGASYIPAMLEELPKMRKDGWVLSVYMHPAGTPTRSAWFDPIVAAGEAAELLFGGRKVPFDYTDPACFEAFLDHEVMELVTDLNLRAYLHDTFSGAATSLIKPAAKGQRRPRRFVGGGGNYEPLRRLDGFNSSRDRMRVLLAGSGEEATMIGENSEEWVDKGIDVNGPGYYYLPNYFMLGESAAATGFGSLLPYFDPISIKTDYPANFRNLNPPLTRIVHHAWTYVFWFSMDFMEAPLKTYQQSIRGPSVDGMTGDEYVLASCCYRAHVLHNGCTLQMQTAYTDGANYNPILKVDEFSRALVTRNPAIDTTGAGLEIAAFCKTLFVAGAENYGEEFLIDGQMERPLEVDYDLAINEKLTNPLNAYSKLQSFTSGEFEQYNNAPFFGTLAFPARLGNNVFDISKVLCSAWRSTDGRIMVMFINWTQGTSTFEGVFNPANYGLTTAYDVKLLNKGGAPTTLASGLSGTSVWRSESAAGAEDVYLGHLPAQSVTLIEVI